MSINDFHVVTRRTESPTNQQRDSEWRRRSEINAARAQPQGAITAAESTRDLPQPNRATEWSGT